MGNIDMESKYSQILIQNGILDTISKVDVTIPDLVGEHFASICEFVRIQYKNEALADTHLFVKKMIPMADAEQRALFEEIMESEGFFLTTFLQALKKLCFERTGSNGVTIDGLFPKVFHADNEAIIMENLTKNGYRMLDKFERQDFDQAKLVIESLARFQAPSHALILQEGGPTAFLTKYPNLVEKMCTPKCEAMMGPMFEPPFDMLLGMLKKSTLTGSQEVYAKLSKHAGKWFSSIAGIIMSHPGSILPVVNHGDCWNNNMMFTVEGAKDKKVVFFDLQTGRVGSPCLDIGYFLFTSTQRNVRKQWRTLLRFYFDKFQEVAKELGISLTATFEDLIAEFRVLSKFGLFFSVFMAVGMDAMKTQDTKDGFFGNNMTEIFDAWISNNADKVDATVQSVIDLFEDYEEIGEF